MSVGGSKLYSDWMSFFVETIKAIREPLATVLGAASCREGWLQGELFRAGRDVDLRVNEFNLGRSAKADVSAEGDPPMVAEIKIVGADYQPKMRHYIEADVERLRIVEDPTIERYMILIIPHSEATGVLAEYLDGCSFSDECFERGFDSFRLRIWKVGN